MHWGEGTHLGHHVYYEALLLHFVRLNRVLILQDLSCDGGEQSAGVSAARLDG